MSEEEAKLYYSIADASLKLKLPKYVIRFWEAKFHQISPMKRAGGRRFFRPDDIKLLLLIKTLLYKNGLTIKGAQTILKGKSKESLINDMYSGMLEKKIIYNSANNCNSKSTTILAIKEILIELKSIRKLLN